MPRVRDLGLLMLTSLACTPTRTDDDEATSSALVPAPVPEVEVPVGDPADAVALAPGANFVCALQRAGTVACWGDNTYGQLGQNYHDDIVMEVKGPFHVKGLTDAVSIAASHSTACAVPVRAAQRYGPGPARLADQGMKMWWQEFGQSSLFT